MLSMATLVDYLDQLLAVEQFSDYSPNGLQIQGSTEIGFIVTGVTASQALLDAALAYQPQAILVHHGYFWKGESPQILGPKLKRIKTLLDHNINLLAYHLPLDTHAIYGNNQQLAQVLELDVESSHTLHGTPQLLWQGRTKSSLSGDEFAQHIAHCLDRKPLHISAKRSIKRVAWCTGGAQDGIEKAHALGVDAYITGEVSERTTHIARELDIHFYAAGHHATERYGVKALGAHIAEHFSIEHHFIDIDNPV